MTWEIWQLLKLGYKQATSDPCIFCLWRDEGFSLIGLYVDDCIAAHNTEAMKQFFLDAFSAEFNQSADSGEPAGTSGGNSGAGIPGGGGGNGGGGGGLMQPSHSHSPAK